MMPYRGRRIYVVPDPPDPLQSYLAAKRRRQYADEDRRRLPYVSLALILGAMIAYSLGWLPFGAP